MTFNAYAVWVDIDTVDEFNPTLVVRSIEPCEIIDIYAGESEGVIDMFEEKYGPLSNYLLEDACQ
tara:strand:+ start:165 stop:359 length:195 start_codon:yes stop_codon:yes gene_type:complete